MHTARRFGCTLTISNLLICLTTAVAPISLGDEPASSPSPSATPAPAKPDSDGESKPGPGKPVAPPAPEEIAPELKGRVYVDEDYQFKVHVPDGWYRANPKNYSAAGELCRVWTPGSESAIMVYRVPTEEPFMPLALLDQTAESMVTKRHAAVLEQEVRTICGKQAIWLIVSGPGNGGAIEGQGMITTIQHMVAFPRAEDAVIFMLGTPEKDFAEIRKVYEKMIDSVEIGGEQTDAQKSQS